MDNKKKISIVMATLMTVQASLQPIAVLAQEVEPEQEEIVVENPEIEEGKAEEAVEGDNQEQPKEEITEESKVPSTGEKESPKELVNEESVVIEKETENQDGVVPQATTHVLSKDKFHQYLIDSQDLTALRFVASEVPAGIDVSNQTDLSENGDRSVIGYKDGTTGIITSGVAGQSVELPTDSSYLVGAEYNDPIYNFIQKLTSISFEAIDTSKVTDMSFMFYKCVGLTTLNVSNFNTSKVQMMSSMFYGCSGLTSLDVSKFDTSKVTNMEFMFTICSSLTTLDLSNFDTANVTNMRAMFYICSSLTTLDLSKFDTSKVTDMGGMFHSCSSLTTLDLSSFNTANVTNMRAMFVFCNGLTILDLSNFNTSNVTDMEGMFLGCDKLITIYGTDWDLGQNNGEMMFEGCVSLIGVDSNNQITPYDASKTNGAMATTNGGYFTVPYKKIAIINFTNEQGQVQKKAFIELSKDDKVIPLDKVLAEIPTGYEPKEPLPIFEVPVTGTTFDVVIQPISVVNWSTTVNYVSNGNIVGTKEFQVTNKQPDISASEVQAGIPTDYEATGQVTGFTATKDGEVFEVEVTEKEVQWTATVKYVTADGKEAGTQNFTVTNKNPKILATDIEKNIPQGYVATDPITDQTVTQDNEVITIQVSPEEVQWTVKINYISNEKAVVGSANFQVTNLNPVVTAAQIEGTIPTGYEAVGTISDVTATQDGQSFDVQVQPVSAPVVNLTATVRFVDQNGTVVGTKTFVVTDQNPVILAQELQAVLPAGMTPVSPLQDLTVKQDGEIFTIEVRTEAIAEETWTITVEFKDEAGNVIGTGSFTVSSNNPVISASELSSQLPTGYKLLFDRPVTVLAESVVDGKGNIAVVVVPTRSGEPTTPNPKEETPNKNIGVNTSAKTLTGLYGALGLGAAGVMSSTVAKRRKKK